jgi:hypothetical protein
MAELSTHGGRREGAGRPRGALNKLTRPVKQLAAEQSAASIDKLVYLRDSAQSEQVQFAAAKELLDRAHGRPRQEIDFNQDKLVTVIVNRGPAASPTTLNATPSLLTHEEEPND